MAYWWCLNHNRVEPDDGCAHQSRLGPFETADEAAEALARAAERTKAWDEQDSADDPWKRG